MTADGHSPADLARMRGRLGLQLENIPHPEITAPHDRALSAQAVRLLDTNAACHEIDVMEHFQRFEEHRH